LKTRLHDYTILRIGDLKGDAENALMANEVVLGKSASLSTMGLRLGIFRLNDA
jgi:hypothetical protein